MRLSAEELTQPISDDLPCGEDLEYDPIFQQMEVMMQSTDEQEFGDTIIPGSGPDWKGVREQVDDLNSRTRDLRVLIYGALADLHLDGLDAFSQSLQSLNSCIESFWSDIYPELDADDNNDPTMRYNILQLLNDHDLVCKGIETAPLVEIQGLGKFSLHDIELAEGKVDPVGDEEVNDIALIQGAFGDTDADTLKAMGESVGGSITELKRTAELWDQLTTDSFGFASEDTLKALSEIHQAIERYAPVAAAAVFDDEESADDDVTGTQEKATPISGSINDRSDVVRAIDKICEYYTVHEPSSPIPVLLRRAQRLVPKSFFEILEDIVPDSVEQAQIIGGYSEQSE